MDNLLCMGVFVGYTVLVIVAPILYRAYMGDPMLLGHLIGYSIGWLILLPAAWGAWFFISWGVSDAECYSPTVDSLSVAVRVFAALVIFAIFGAWLSLVNRFPRLATILILIPVPAMLAILFFISQISCV